MLFINIAQKPTFYNERIKAMEFTVCFMIKDGKKEDVEIKACSKDSATIFIKADSIEKASSLLLQAEPKAKEAMQSWNPVKKEEPKKQDLQKHYRASNTAIEDIQAKIDEYTSTPAGAKFVNTLETAKEFCYKKAYGGMKCSELIYFYNLAFTCNEGDAISGAYHLAYWRGYNKAKSEQRRKAGSKC